MLVVMHAHATQAQTDAVCDQIRRMGFIPHPMPGANRTAIGITGNPGPVDPEAFADCAGVAQAIPVTQPYKLVLHEMRDDDTIVEIPAPHGNAVQVGGPEIVLMAGPCAVEGRDMMHAVAAAVRDAGASMLRGGAFKPRTSPYAFQGLGEEGLGYLAQAGATCGLPVVTEAVDIAGVDRVEAHANVIQIGARNMQHYSLLRRVGQSRLPVLLKRGMSATLGEFLQAAEYILAEGNYNVILCERGVRTFSDHTRNTLDLSAVPVLKRLSHLPVIVDPSHATGARTEVGPMALAAVAAGADGLLIEVHPDPTAALSDGPQSLTPADFAALVSRLRRVASAVDRTIRQAPDGE
jgi:3-deoxy-7-phosphoheptulonate synthase